MYSYETMINIHIYLIFLVLIFSIIDCLLLFKIRKSNLHLNNHYVKLQSKYGLIAVTIVKVIWSIFLCYFLLNPTGNAGAVGGIAILYCLVVLIFLKDFFKAMRSIGRLCNK